MRQKGVLGFLFSLGVSVLSPARGEAIDRDIVLKPGESVKLKHPDTVRTGLKTVGARRYVPLQFTAAQASPADKGLRVTVGSALVEVFANPGAQGKQYQVTASQLAKEQIYRKVRRKFQWVDTRKTRTTSRSFTIIVDVAPPPTVIVGAGSIAEVDLPGRGVRWNVVKKKSKVAAARQGGTHRALVEGKKAGKTSFSLRYRIGKRKFRALLKVEVVEENPAFAVNLRTGESRSLTARDAARSLNATEAKFGRMVKSPQATAATILPDAKTGSLLVSGLQPGQSRAVLMCTGKRPAKRGKWEAFQANLLLVVSVK